MGCPAFGIGLDEELVIGSGFDMHCGRLEGRIAGHVGFEVGLFIVQGRVLHKFGKGLRESLENGAGDFIFIEPGLPHEVYNLSDSEPIVAVVARTSPNQWDEIIPYDPADE